MSNDRSHSNVMTVFAAVIALAEIGARLVPLLTHRSVATLFYSGRWMSSWDHVFADALDCQKQACVEI